MTKIAALHTTFQESADNYIQVIDETNAQKNDNVVAAMDKFIEDGKKLDEALVEFENIQTSDGEESKAAAALESRNAIMEILVISIIAGILGISIGLYISRTITKPVDEVLSGAKTISDHDNPGTNNQNTKTNRKSAGIWRDFSNGINCGRVFVLAKEEMIINFPIFLFSTRL